MFEIINKPVAFSIQTYWTTKLNSNSNKMTFGSDGSE